MRVMKEVCLEDSYLPPSLLTYPYLSAVPEYEGIEAIPKQTRSIYTG